MASADHAAGEGPALVMAVGAHNSHFGELITGRSIDIESACYTTCANALLSEISGVAKVFVTAAGNSTISSIKTHSVATPNFLRAVQLRNRKPTRNHARPMVIKNHI